jgi:hypothetical protein
MAKYEVELHEILWETEWDEDEVEMDPEAYLPFDFTVLVDADDVDEAVERATEVASDEFGFLIRDFWFDIKFVRE